TSVVLPKPAGAETRASLWLRLVFRRSCRRERATASGRVGGRNSLVPRIGGNSSHYTCSAPYGPAVPQGRALDGRIHTAGDPQHADFLKRVVERCYRRSSLPSPSCTYAPILLDSH